jgi:hypothetical protein
MEIQYGQVGMKTAKFNTTMGATAGCTIRILLSSTFQEEQDPSMGYEVTLGLAVITLQMRLASMGILFPENALKETLDCIYIMLQSMKRGEVKLVAIGYLQ